MSIKEIIIFIDDFYFWTYTINSCKKIFFVRLILFQITWIYLSMLYKAVEKSIHMCGHGIQMLNINTKFQILDIFVWP